MRFPFFTRRKPVAEPVSLRAQTRRNARRALIRETTDKLRAANGQPPIDWDNL